MRRRGGLRIAVVLALAAASCSGYTAGIRRDTAVDDRFAYLYGRFFMKTEPNNGPGVGFGGKRSMGLVIRCQDGAEYIFGSLDSRDIQVLKIRPSHCWLIEVRAADQNGVIRQRLPAPPGLPPLNFTAGLAYYIGDYFAKGDVWVHPGLWKKTVHWEWAMSPADDRYPATTAEMKATFPNLASWPTVSTPFIHGPERKRDNGIGPSPGEPSMSPERIARIAPFIKRNYGTPAECEGACSVGQCLPYRGDTGPAMACVIRCDRDADCPDGLACNCPNQERAAGPGCRPIAATPQDPMARICLSVETAGQRR